MTIEQIFATMLLLETAYEVKYTAQYAGKNYYASPARGRGPHSSNGCYAFDRKNKSHGVAWAISSNSVRIHDDQFSNGNRNTKSHGFAEAGFRSRQRFVTASLNTDLPMRVIS